MEMLELSTRAKKAYVILFGGGKFVQRLERDRYTGREQWKYHLETNEGIKISGFGVTTFYELDNLGLLSLDNSTSVSSYYRLNKNN
jgi:hypothetical protein